MTPLRILALTAFAPRRDARHGGARVSAELLTRLAARHRIAVLTLRGPDEAAVDADLARFADQVEEVARPEAGGRLAQRLVRSRGLLHGLPRWAAEWRVPAYTAAAAALAERWRPDAVQVHYEVMGQFLRALDGTPAPRVLVSFEPGSARAEAEAAELSGARRLARRLDAAAWRRYERALLDSVDAAVALTERDRAALAALRPEARIEVIPFGVPLAERPLDPAGTEGSVIFVGNFEHAPNVDAAVRLARAIHPRVAAEHGAVRLTLVGAKPPAEVRALTSATVEVAGSVLDVAPYLNRAAVVAIPLRTGGGMRVKTLEALAAGKAVVASPLALEGIDVADGEQVVVAETDEQFASAILGLLGDPERRRRLATAARGWAEANTGWERRVAAHEALLQSLVEGRRG